MGIVANSGNGYAQVDLEDGSNFLLSEGPVDVRVYKLGFIRLPGFNKLIWKKDVKDSPSLMRKAFEVLLGCQLQEEVVPALNDRFED